jgi:hypothetical protein
MTLTDKILSVTLGKCVRFPMPHIGTATKGSLYNGPKYVDKTGKTFACSRQKTTKTDKALLSLKRALCIKSIKEEQE